MIYDPDKALVAQAEQEAEHTREVARLRASMPVDPTLGLDANFLREYGVPAALFIKQAMLGEREATTEQLACAKMLLPIETRAQATKVQTEVSIGGAVAEFVAVLRQSSLTLEQIDALEAEVDRQAHDNGIALH